MSSHDWLLDLSVCCHAAEPMHECGALLVLTRRHVSLRSIANITAPVVVDGVKILEFPRVRGDAHSGAPELGWVRHQLRGSWRAAAAKDAGSSSAERRS